MTCPHKDGCLNHHEKNDTPGFMPKLCPGCDKEFWDWMDRIGSLK